MEGRGLQEAEPSLRNRLTGLPIDVRLWMAKNVEEFVYRILVEVFNAKDTAPLGIEAILEDEIIRPGAQGEADRRPEGMEQGKDRREGEGPGCQGAGHLREGLQRLILKRNKSLQGDSYTGKPALLHERGRDEATGNHSDVSHDPHGERGSRGDSRFQREVREAPHGKDLGGRSIELKKLRLNRYRISWELLTGEITVADLVGKLDGDTLDFRQQGLRLHLHPDRQQETARRHSRGAEQESGSRIHPGVRRK